MGLVLDASMTIAWLLPDETTASSQTVLHRVKAEGAVVPTIWHLEVANALQSASRRGRCDEAYIDRSLRRLAKLVIVIDDETGGRAWNAILGLARNEALTVYDASYLDLALRLGLPLATADAKLINAAKRRQVEVFSN